MHVNTAIANSESCLFLNKHSEKDFGHGMILLFLLTLKKQTTTKNPFKVNFSKPCSQCLSH